MTEEKDSKTIQDELNDIEVEDSDDDLFEKVLNDDINVPSEDDASSGTSDKNTEDNTQGKEDGEDAKEDDEVTKLRAQVAQLEKEAKGRLSDVVKSRQEKRQFQSELDQLKGAVTALLDKRNNTTESDENDDGEEEVLGDTAKVEFGEDDKAYVDLSKIKKAIAAETGKTQKELEELRLQDEVRKAKETYRNNVQSIISEKEEEYKPAYDKLKDTYTDLNDSIIELQKRTGEHGNNGVLTQDQALDLFSGSPEETEFLKSHPGVDPTRIARAFNSRLDLKTTLNHMVKVHSLDQKVGDKAKGLDKDLDDRIQKAKDKPGTLGGHENRDTKTSDLIERVSRLDWGDMEKMSDAEAAKIEQLLLQQELKGD